MTKVVYPDGRTVTYSYDPTGNRTQMVDSSGGITSYSYDAADELLSAGSQTFTYNATAT